MPPFSTFAPTAAVRPTADGYGLTVSWFAASFVLVFAGEPPLGPGDYPRWRPLSPVRLVVACRAVSPGADGSPPAGGLWLPVSPMLTPPRKPLSAEAWLFERLGGGASFGVDVAASSHPAFRGRVHRNLAPTGDSYQLRLSVPPALVVEPGSAARPLVVDVASDALGLEAHFATPAAGVVAAFVALAAACGPMS